MKQSDEELLGSIYNMARTFHETRTRTQVQTCPALCRAVEILRRALDPRPDRVFMDDRDLVERLKPHDL